MAETLIDADELARTIDECVVVDCRHDLLDVEAGRRAYLQGHIPGAFFLHMDEDLSGPRNGRNGRHPLPDRDALRRRLEAIGLDDERQLVAYDASGGQMAARLWWLARWLGHRRVAVLDGDLAAWQRAGYPLSTELPKPRAGRLSQRAPLALPVDADEVLARQTAGIGRLVDARAPERYRGETEPIDPIAGRIPGAVNRYSRANLREDGRFKPAAVLRGEFDALLGAVPPAEVVHQCGSGVAACHNLLAMEHAGLGGSRLYAGSWSEWIADPSRPIARGAD